MPRLTAIVLGSAAGGGVPQWNCCCPVCRLAWSGSRRVRPRTQTGLAISADAESWTLINASPDLRAQIGACPLLRPRGDKRASPIAAVVVTGAEIDQIAGLLHMREGGRYALLGTAEALGAIDRNAMFDALWPTVTRRAVAPGEPFALPGDLEAELFCVPGKVPLYLENDDPQIGEESGANVGVEIRADATRLVFVPGAAAITPRLLERLAHADVVLFDGTLYRDDEMIVAGLGTKTGRRMGHVSIAGPDGSLASLAKLRGRRIYIHINNTNPVLIEDSPERSEVEQAGFEVAYDGMEITP
jgi:pyrroloquinoline quinone biosynthesis protein B